MSKELSTSLITHKLVIKWEWIKYIWEDFAKWIFSQLANPEKKTITIANPETLLFITKYRSEIQLVPLDNENQSFEDKLEMYWMNEWQKNKMRNIWDQRKKDNKSLHEDSFIMIIKEIKNNKI